MADRVAILLRGQIAATGTPAGADRHRRRPDQGLGAHAGRQPGRPQHRLPAVSQQAIKEDYTIYFSTDIGPTVSAIIAAHRGPPGDTLIDLRVERPSLEDRFLEITQPGGGAR